MKTTSEFKMLKRILRTASIAIELSFYNGILYLLPKGREVESPLSQAGYQLAPKRKTQKKGEVSISKFVTQ